MIEKVRDGSVDLGLVPFPPTARDLVVLPWREEEMVLACQPTHPLARRASVRLGQLSGEKYIAFDKDLGIRRQVDRFLRQQGVAGEGELEFDNIENIKKGIEIAGGVALLPEPTLRQEVDAGLLVARPLADCRFMRPLAIIYRRQQRPSPAVQRFIDLLLENGNCDAQKNGNGTAHQRGAARKKK